ncbi:MAG: hypothetical protein ACPGOY_08400 [Rhodospirillaceae bacterium]
MSLARRVPRLLIGLGFVALTAVACAPESGGGGFSNAPPLSISSPAVLQGKDSGAVQAALGRPSLLRKEPPSQVWQYLGQSCVLDFYLAEQGGRMVVRHIEARNRRGGGAASDGACLRDVHESRYRQGGVPSV